MANDLNQCNFIGRLGADPETRYSPDGTAFCSFRIAVGWKTKEKEGAEWISIVTSGKLAEICGEYLRKGKQCFVSGRFVTRKWQDKDGADRYSTEIRADRMQLLGGRDGDDAGAGSGRPREANQRPASRPAGYSDGQNDYARAKDGRAPLNAGRQAAPKSATGFDGMDDDIPF